ncbi:MAG TPA: methyltransferase [Thermoanaerobaculia bacterium]|nr:methyltransferase [Thermoanaerobaculia bacterium]
MNDTVTGLQELPEVTVNDTTTGPRPHEVMLQMMMGMFVSQILGAVAQLGIPDKLAGGPLPIEELATACGADRDALYRLLRAASTAGALTESGDKHFGLTPIGETLRSNVPGSLRDLLIAQIAPGHWLPWGKLADAVRRGGSTISDTLGVPDLWTYYAENGEEAQSFARGMSNVSAIAAQEVASVVRPNGARLIIDVGGSEGILLRGLLERMPDAHGVIFDRADVIAHVQPAERVEVVAGNFLESVPAGADLYVLKHILHDWPDENCEAILRNCHRAAPEGGRLLVVEMLLPESGSSPITFVDMNMLVMFRGRERTESEYEALLRRCGWELEQVIPTTGMFSVLEAVKIR